MWQIQQPFVDLFQNSKMGFSDFINHYLRPNVFLDTIKTNLGCMDGRINRRRIAFPGPGVLWNEEEIERVACMLEEAGIVIKNVSRHHQCGAEAIAIAKLLNEGHSEEQARSIIENRVNHLARRLNADVCMSGMINTAVHIERALLITGTKTFDVTRLPLQIVFQINARFSLGNDALCESVDLVQQIARRSKPLGDHAFNEMNPFCIGIIGNPLKEQFCAQALLEAIQPAIKPHGSTIIVRSMDVPDHFLLPKK